MSKRPPRRKKGPVRRRRRGEPELAPKVRARAHAAVAALPGGAVEGARAPDGSGATALRLNRWLSEQGVASRRKADELIQEGAVEVNGEPQLSPGYRVQEGDRVAVNGRPVKRVRRLYYLFNKPKGVLCTEDPRENRPRVRDVVAGQVAGRVYPVGRLDEDSEGLLLLTNDGEFANLMAHPRYGVPKTYVAHVPGSVTAEDAARMRAGVHLDTGKAVPDSVRILKRSKQGTAVKVVLREGRNREVRRIFAKLGYGVKSLKRVQIGPLRLQGVPRGQVRPLTAKERADLLDLVQAPAGAAEPAGKPAGEPAAPSRRSGRSRKAPPQRRTGRRGPRRS